MSDWAAGVVAATTAALADGADPERAAGMRAYMRDQFAFLGLTSPQRCARQQQAWAGVRRPTASELVDAAEALWTLAEREHQYAACDLLAVNVDVLAAGVLTPTIERLIVTRAWWDTVDALRSAAVGPLALRHPDRPGVIWTWAESGSRWLVRSAIIHQLGYGRATDEELLFALCRRHAGDSEFFVAKAIGWALRTHARTSPDAVRAFVASQRALTPLACREALKHL